MSTKIFKTNSKVLNIKHPFAPAETIATIDTDQLTVFGDPDSMLDMKEGAVEIINKGGQTLAYTIRESIDRNTIALDDSNMRKTADATTVVAGASALHVLGSNSCHVKVYIKSNAVGLSTEARICFKGISL